MSGREINFYKQEVFFFSIRHCYIGCFWSYDGFPRWAMHTKTTCSKILEAHLSTQHLAGRNRIDVIQRGWWNVYRLSYDWPRSRICQPCLTSTEIMQCTIYYFTDIGGCRSHKIKTSCKDFDSLRLFKTGCVSDSNAASAIVTCQI